jgi:hypothetical protein
VLLLILCIAVASGDRSVWVRVVFPLAIIGSLMLTLWLNRKRRYFLAFARRPSGSTELAELPPTTLATSGIGHRTLLGPLYPIGRQEVLSASRENGLSESLPDSWKTGNSRIPNVNSYQNR